MGGLIGAFLQDIPGVKQVEDTIKDAEYLWSQIGKLINEIPVEAATRDLAKLVKHQGNWQHLLENLTKLAWTDIEKFGAGTLFKEYLELGLGVPTKHFDADAKKAISTVESMITFAWALPVGITVTDAILDFLLGGRAPKLKEGILGRAAEELGLTWALGMTIDRLFETALGQALEEAVLEYKRPTQLDWRVLRLLLRQHVIDEKFFIERLRKLGYSEKLIGHIKGLADTNITVGDIQQLYLHGEITAAQVEPMIETLGFSKDDAKRLKTLYITHAETTAGNMYRSTARSLFREKLIPEGTYRHILEATNTPPLEIDDDIAAIKLEQEHGRLHASAATIKIDYQHGQLHADQVINALRNLGYSPDAASRTLLAWDQGPLPHPMPASKVLTYWYSGVITDRSDAYNRLIASHLRGADANFLLDHPKAAGARKHALTPALVTQAYLDGVIDDSQYPAALTKAGLDDSAVQYEVGVAQFKKSRQRRPAHATVPLTATQLVDAWYVGVMDPGTALDRLTHLGYSYDDAFLLLEIKHKGSLSPGGTGEGFGVGLGGEPQAPSFGGPASPLPPPPAPAPSPPPPVTPM